MVEVDLIAFIVGRRWYLLHTVLLHDLWMLFSNSLSFNLLIILGRWSLLAASGQFGFAEAVLALNYLDLFQHACLRVEVLLMHVLRGN